MSAKRLCKVCMVIDGNKLFVFILIIDNATPSIVAGTIAEGCKCITPKINELIITANIIFDLSLITLYK